MVARVPFGSLFNFASKSGSVSNLADRKSTRLNSSHDQISYAVFCLRSKEHTSELQSRSDIVCRLLLEKKTGPVSPPRHRNGGGGHSSRTRVAAGLERAYPGARRATVAARSAAPLFALAPGGACRAAAVTGGAVRSCRTVSPLPAFRPAVCSLWRCPASRLGWPLASTLPCGARTFLPRVIAPASARAAPTAHQCNATAAGRQRANQATAWSEGAQDEGGHLLQRRLGFGKPRL